MSYIKKLGWMLVITVILFQLVCCGKGKIQQETGSDDSSYIFTMGTVFGIRVFSDNARSIIQEIEQELYACDDLISWREEGSLAAQFNVKQEADMSEIGDVMKTALEVSRDSEGAFDMTVLPLSTLWNFDRMGDSEFDISEMKVPDISDIEEAKDSVDYTQLAFDPASGVLSTENPDIKIELGAIGKGYAIQKTREILSASNVSGGMVSAGSSIFVYGTKNDGSNFRVALRDPRGDENSAIGILTLTDTTISTSGDYERYFEQEGVRYHHILDPRTGYPADSGLMQVTIICEDSVLGDALSTACFVLGLDKGMELAGQYGVLAIFVDNDKNIWYNNSDIVDMFEFKGKNSGYILKEYNQTHS
ncbi:MAG: FAD:protein FMN transferase [Coprococcus sp.]